jgi:hypothetical protein
VHAGQIFLIAGIALGLACASAVVVVAIATFRVGRVAARSRALLAPCRRSLIIMVSGDDDDGQAREAPCTVSAAVWARPASARRHLPTQGSMPPG